MNIFTAIKCSNLGKYQKAIDKCNNKNGCNSCCSKETQKNCDKLINHRNEMANLKYEV
jgi:hypothetical protein